MAANNYFGFATGGTQYGSATPSPANYTANQATAGYAVQHTAQPYAAAATPRASQPTYETYQQPAHTTTNYPYATRQQTTYEKAQTYYQAQVPYSTTETPHYQTVSSNKPVYSTTNVSYNTRQAAAKAQTAAAQQPAATYMYSTGATTTGSAANYNTSYNNAAAATTTYSASMYVQQPSVTAQPVQAPQAAVAQQQVQSMQSSATSVTTPKTHTNNWMPFKKGPIRVSRPKLPPKPQQLHYCEVCKISCAGPQTYKEHLDGQKHKKKEAAGKTGVVTHINRGGTTLKCELCDVTCTGSDAYAAHIRGAKHQKVVKLHTKLGKPIPSTEPQVLGANSGSSSTIKSSPAENKTAPKTSTVKKVGPPKITFIASSQAELCSVDAKQEMEEDDDKETDGSKDDKEIQPVGQDYIEEIKSDDGKVVSFQCKLCECRFNDPNAKEMHMKGRRHRLQYKKKVNPELVVDVKPSLRHRKIQEDRYRRQQLMDDYYKRREEERWREEMRLMEEEERLYWEERRRYEDELEYYEWHRRFNREPRLAPPMPPPPPPRPFLTMPLGGMNHSTRKPDSVDDRHVIAKHTQIYPKEEELNAVQKIITNSEKALKLVSDFLTEKSDKKDVPKGPEVAATDEKEKSDAKGTDTSKDASAQPYRVLKGVMRVGVLAKGLVLTGDLNVQLVVMCAEKPTRTLLERVIDNLPKQLASIAPDDKYEVKRCVEEAAILVSSVAEPKITVTVTLTSPVMREANVETGANGEPIKDPPDVLDRQKCLDALAALRHAKWFQARASGLQSCVMLIRILRDLCQRVPTWGRLNGWAMELLVEKVLSSSGQPMSPGDALRRVFEAIAAGVLLPGSSGLLDPCEKEPTDASGTLTPQEREDITASGQHALRLIAFRQIHKVLGMDALPPPKFVKGNQFTRKRRRDNSTSEGNESEGVNGKKDKKDIKAEPMESSDPKA